MLCVSHQLRRIAYRPWAGVGHLASFERNDSWKIPPSFDRLLRRTRQPAEAKSFQRQACSAGPAQLFFQGCKCQYKWNFRLIRRRGRPGRSFQNHQDTSALIEPVLGSSREVRSLAFSLKLGAISVKQLAGWAVHVTRSGGRSASTTFAILRATKRRRLKWNMPRRMLPRRGMLAKHGRSGRSSPAPKQRGTDTVRHRKQ